MDTPAGKLKAAIIVTSDRAFQGEYEDLSGPAAQHWLHNHNFQTTNPLVIPDEEAAIKENLLNCIKETDLVVVSGGTGLGPRDRTPQVLDEVCDYEVKGFGELMRQGSAAFTRNAYLSRCGGWVKEQKLILAVPGNHKAVTEQLSVLADLLPSALTALKGKCQHRGRLQP